MSGLVGRAREVGVADGFLADGLAEPRALLIDGEPGIGKTAFLQHLLATAQSQGHAILACRPTRSESDLSYSGLVELLGNVEDAVLDALPAPQARVLKALLRREDPHVPFDRLSLGIATVAAVRMVASTRSVLIAIDDAQWLDRPTTQTVTFLLRRLAGTAARIAMVRSERRGLAPSASGVALDWLSELARAVPEGRLDALRLGPIEPSELSRILRRVLGWAPAWPRVVRITELSAGNPLYALELARAFGAARTGEDLDHVLPEGVFELARSRIAKLPRRVRRAVELASVPAAPTLDLLCRLDSAILDPRGDLEAATRRGILTIEADRVRFTHPILAAAA